MIGEKFATNYGQWVRRAVAQKRGQKDIITFFDSSVPEPTALVQQVVSEAFSGPITSRYASAFNGGNPFILDLLANRYGLGRESVLGTTGATSALSLIYRALVQPGEHILVETPGFDLFQELAQSQGIRVSQFSRDGDRFTVNLNDLVARLQPTTKLIVISNLHNPSGMAVSTADLETLARLVEARGIRVVVDEVYGEYADYDTRPRAAAQISPAFISVSSLTKIYGLSTLRCGWIVAAPEIMLPIRTLADRTDVSISNLAHAVAALILEQPAKFDAYTRNMVGEARPLVEESLRLWKAERLVDGILPEFGCIFFPRLVGIENSAAFVDWLAKRSGVLIAPGEFFGAPGHIRIGFARELGELKAGLSALTDGLRTFRAHIGAGDARRSVISG